MGSHDKPGIKTRIKFGGEFSLKKLLGAIRGWFGKTDYTYEELVYKHKGDDVEYVIDAMKHINTYVTYHIKLKLKIIHFKDKGNDMNEGRMWIEITSKVELDWQNKFKGGILEAAQEFMDRYILKKTIENKWEGEVYIDMTNFQKTIRQAIGMETSI